jgi:hypothetical protein
MVWADQDWVEEEMGLPEKLSDVHGHEEHSKFHPERAMQ